MKISLERVKRSHRIAHYISRRNVRIWSGEHQAYWGPAECGYYDLPGAAIYQGEEALLVTSSCGPDKKIEFEIIRPSVRSSPQVTPSPLRSYWNTLRDYMPTPWSMHPLPDGKEIFETNRWKICDARGQTIIASVPKMVADRILCAVHGEAAHQELRSEVCLYLACYNADKEAQLVKVGAACEKSFYALHGRTL